MTNFSKFFLIFWNKKHEFGRVATISESAVYAYMDASNIATLAITEACAVICVFLTAIYYSALEVGADTDTQFRFDQQLERSSLGIR